MRKNKSNLRNIIGITTALLVGAGIFVIFFLVMMNIIRHCIIK